MYVINVTDYDKMTNNCNESLSINNNCTNNENDIDIISPTLLLKIPCGLSFLSLMGVTIYTLSKTLFRI